MNLSNEHKLRLQEFFATRPIKKAYHFGSYARNEADPDSDIDLLVELDHSHPIGMRFFTFLSELEDLLEAKVDLVTVEGLSKHVKPIVEREKILICERSAE